MGLALCWLRFRLLERRTHRFAAFLIHILALRIVSFGRQIPHVGHSACHGQKSPPASNCRILLLPLLWFVNVSNFECVEVRETAQKYENSSRESSVVESLQACRRRLGEWKVGC
jgi:hypothetical protein